MKKLYQISTVGILFLFFLSACDECESEVNKLRIVSFEPSYLKINGKEAIEGSDSMFIVNNYNIDSIGLRFDSIGISIYNNLESFSKRNDFLFINAAYACEPVFYFYGIDSMFIYSDQNYDNTYPAGTNLRSIVGLSNGNLSTDINDNELNGSIAFIHFKSPPLNNLSHTLTIKYKLSNGNTTTSVLPKVKILKP